MKYTARHVRKFLSEGKIDATLWTAHFPLVLVSHVPTCNDCEDYKTKACEGGKNPVDCFLAIQPDIKPVFCSTVRYYKPDGEKPEILPQQQRQCQVTPYRDTKRVRPVKDITPEHIFGSEEFLFLR